jgi:FixJ family two-component response regulator
VAVFVNGVLCAHAARIQTPVGILLAGGSLDILPQLEAVNYSGPVLILFSEQDIPGAIKAIRNGAFDFIDKRLDPETIAFRVREAIDRWARGRRNDFIYEVALPSLAGYDQLTSREREVLFQITAAASMKETGRNLGISPHTVGVHRRRVLRKLNAKHSVTLVRTVLEKVRSLPD